MAWVRVGTPPVFQSKLLCLSLFYLSTTLPFSIYISLSPSLSHKCLFIPFPSSFTNSNKDHLLFSYPQSYAQHKHALPSSRSLCSSPIHFSGYEEVFEEMSGMYKKLSNSRRNPDNLRYETGSRSGSSSFSGNYSFEIRKSFFNYSDEKEVPCGFFRELPIRDEDRLQMESCSGLVVASAIFNDHDKIRQPRGLGSKTLTSVCFFMFIDDSTLKTLISHQILPQNRDRIRYTIGAWRIVTLPTDRLPYENPAMNGVIFKHLPHRLFPNSHFSVWVDAKLQLTVDPTLLVHSVLVKTGADMAVSKHPFNVHTVEEAMATVRWRKWGDVEGIRVQMERYCESGLQPWSPLKLPYQSDVPDTALIIRRHNIPTNLFSCLTFNELEAFNPRDQLTFAFVRDFMNPKININMFDVEVFEHVAIEYRHNIKRQSDGNIGNETNFKIGSLRSTPGLSCERYLSKMWGEATD